MRADVSIDSACPACAGGRLGYLGIQTSAPQTFTWLACSKCRSAFAQPRLTSHELRLFYEDHYEAPHVEIPEVVERSLRATVASFEPFRTGEGTLIDVGFGEGTLLRLAQAIGWRCSGTEYARSAIEWGRRVDVAVHEGDLVDGALPGPFDVATVIETLEHTLDPLALLESIHTRLRPGGLVYGTTPNMAGLSARSLGTRWSVVAAPEHLELFSPKGLRALLLTVGFWNVDIETRGLNVAEIRHRLLPRDTADFDRVQSAYALNESLESSMVGHITKLVANRILRSIGGGDTIVFRALRA